MEHLRTQPVALRTMPLVGVQSRFMTRSVGSVLVASAVLAACLLGGCSRFAIGYEYWNFGKMRHEHRTHPDDRGFLAGEAGSTTLRDGHFAKLSGREDIPLDELSPLVPYVKASLLAGFAEVAGGHNFRDQRAERYRHRYYRKGKYSYDMIGEISCVGCGRCISACTVEIANPVEIFNRLLDK